MSHHRAMLLENRCRQFKHKNQPKASLEETTAIVIMAKMKGIEGRIRAKLYRKIFLKEMTVAT